MQNWPDNLTLQCDSPQSDKMARNRNVGLFFSVLDNQEGFFAIFFYLQTVWEDYTSVECSLFHFCFGILCYRTKFARLTRMLL